jgi:hypothetical protein
MSARTDKFGHVLLAFGAVILAAAVKAILERGFEELLRHKKQAPRKRKPRQRIHEPKAKVVH